MYTHIHACYIHTNMHTFIVPMCQVEVEKLSTLPAPVIADFDHFCNYKYQRTAGKEIGNENSRKRTDPWQSLPVRNGMDLEWRIPSIPFYSFMQEFGKQKTHGSFFKISWVTKSS